MKNLISIAIVITLVYSVSLALSRGPVYATYQFERLTNNAEDDFGPSICVDRLGRPHVAWIRGQPSTYEIYYGLKQGSWNISKVTDLSS